LKPHRIKHALAAALVSAGVAFAPAASYGQSAPQQATPKSERHRVVLQVSDADPAKWNLALNNARNVQEDLGKANVDVEIVAYGPGLGMLKSESKVADRLAQALDNNVGLMACENTMRNTKVGKADMYGGISYVDAGVVHLMKRQREGWAYIRP
jgi:intracellular sulfur oxidation DsrE/DsrF family protein